MKESEVIQEDIALKQMTGPTAREAADLARAKTLDKQEQLGKISRALAVLASASVSMPLSSIFTSQYLPG